MTTPPNPKSEIQNPKSPPPRPRQPDGRVHGVVVACQRPDGRWLCIRRSATVAAPLKVCFPGGAMEVNESQENAVIREMHEELGSTVRPRRRVWKWDSPTSELTLWGWTADYPDGELRPDPDEVAEVLWLTGEEVIGHADAMATNEDFVKSLEEAAVNEASGF
jgi:8-oxo-dGTP pyrophosphatase MutT (NUDIX family)